MGREIKIYLENELVGITDTYAFTMGEIDAFAINNFEYSAGDNIRYCLSTTILDKNGTKIFEGDRVKVQIKSHERIWEDQPDIRTGEIIFHKGSFMIKSGYNISFSEAEEIEVIGNIHQNK